MTTKLPFFNVTADRLTGEFLTISRAGEVDAAEHAARVDTDEVHYDRHEFVLDEDGDVILGGRGETETCAIEVRYE